MLPHEEPYLLGKAKKIPSNQGVPNGYGADSCGCCIGIPLVVHASWQI